MVGRALADFFGVPYFMFQVDRRRPPGLLDSFNREYVVQNQWMPIDESRNGLYLLAVDPDQLKASGAAQRVFPNAKPIYCVTTRREFGWMVNQFFGAPQVEAVETTMPPTAAPQPGANAVLPGAAAAPATPWDAAGTRIGPWHGMPAPLASAPAGADDAADATIVQTAPAMPRTAMPAPPSYPAMPALPDVEQTLIANAIGQIALQAGQQGIRELHIETTPGADGDIHFKVTGVMRLSKP